MNPQGLMTLGFAVDLQPNGMSAAPLLWRSSIYAEKPDPSFVLPKKFSFYNTKWVPNTDMLSATEMRSTLYYDNESKDKVLDNDVLTPGKSYTVSVPVYNASFLPASNVKVSLAYKRYREKGKIADFSGATPIGSADISLTAWTSGRETNKTYANFTWNVPSNLETGQYMLIARIDPENKIDEVHEEWSKDVPGGNNTGYSMVAVQPANVTPKTPTSFDVKAKKADAGAVVAGADADGNYYPPADVYRNAKDTSGDYGVTLEVTAIGNFDYTNAQFDVVQYVSKDNGEEVGYILDSDTYLMKLPTHNRDFSHELVGLMLEL